MTKEKVMAVTFGLLGLVSLVLGAGVVYMAMIMGEATKALAVLPGDISGVTAFLGTVSVALWLVGVLEILLAIASFASSFKLFKK
jgi:hypothetical protein